MKSAYELAMERLAKEAPETTRPLSDAQKQSLAELDRLYQSKIAEREVFLTKQLNEARAGRDLTAIEQIETQLRNERIRLQEEKEAAKDRVRQGT